MSAAPMPGNEPARLDALRALNVLDSPPEPEFDALVQAAAMVCGVPISMISLVDADRQWFKASAGPVPFTEAPRDISFCSHAILQDELFEVPDATQDLRFADSPFVAGHPDIRFYAGATLRLSDGANVGTLCVLDVQPRRLDARQREVLRLLASAVVKALESRRAVQQLIAASQALQQSEAKFRVLSEASPLGVFAVDARSRATYTNARLQEILGLGAEESLGDGWFSGVHPEERARVQSAWLRSAKQLSEYKLAHRVLRPDGQVVHVHVRARPIISADGTTTGFIGSIEDITERLQAERDLHDERQRLAFTLQGTGAGIWEWHVPSGKARYDAAWASMTGWSLEELSPLSFHSFARLAHPDDLARTQTLLGAHYAGKTASFESEIRLRHRDGRWVWVLARGRVMTWTADGQPEWMYGTLLDLSSQKRQEEALRKSAQFLNRTGKVAGIGGWELDLNQNVLFWSDAVCRMHDHAPGHQPTAQEALDCYLPESRRVMREVIERARHDSVGWDVEVEVVTVTGRRLWVRNVAEIETENGQPVRALGAFQDITTLVLQRRAIEQANERLALATESGNIAIWEFNVRANTLTLDAIGCTAYGMPGTGATLTMGQWAGLLHPDDRDRAMAAASAAVRTGASLDTAFRVVWPDGSVHHLRATARLTRDALGRPLRLVGANWDVTALHRLGAELAEQHELLRVTLQSIGDAVVTTDAAGHVTWLNPIAERMTGWSAPDAVGCALEQVFRIVDEDTRTPAKNPVAACLQQGGVACLARHTVLLSRQGGEFGIQESAAPIRDDQGRVLGAVLVFHDVTEQRRLAGEMSYRAKHDALTGLVNRSEFEAQLRQLLERVQQDGSEHTLMFIDLDQFKLVNDACGHSVGDQLLQQVSKLLMESVRSRDTLARLGGDEFAIILSHCPAAKATGVAQAICDRMDDFRFVHDGRRFRLGASIGLVPLDQRWATPAAAMQAADTSCYAAKEAGRNRVHVWFDTDLTMQARHGETRWATRIEQALDDDRLVLFAQRITAIQPQPGHPGIHAEVLLRMLDVDGSLIPPGAFLPAAERFHLSMRIDRWVLRHAVDWLIALADPGRLGRLCINLSGQSIGDRVFHRHATQILAEAGEAVCQRICLEITETAAITNLADAALFIDEVRRFGVQIALDDFGAGASSFGYLKTLAVDVLKIDGQFITDLLDDPLDDAAVRCFVDVARVCGLKTVAEFVDSPAVLERLREIGVDYAQGFLLHRPEPIEALFGQARTAQALTDSRLGDLCARESHALSATS